MATNCRFGKTRFGLGKVWRKKRQRCTRHRSLFSRATGPERLEDRWLLSVAPWDGDQAFDANPAMKTSAITEPVTVAGEILVGFEGDVAALFRNHGMAVAMEAAGQVVGDSGLHNPKLLMDVPAAVGRAARLTTLWQLPDDSELDAMINRLRDLPGIAYAEPNYVLSMAEPTIPNDSQFDELWGLHNTGQTGGLADADIDAPEAWSITTGSHEIVVGVIDTGVDYSHPDLVSNMWTNPGEIPDDGIDNDGNGYVDDVYGWDFVNDDNDPYDDNGHGTHCAGTIAAEGDNATGVTGVNWNAQIMALKFLNSGGNGTTADAIEAVNYATMMNRDFGVNIRLTSSSWGGGAYSEALEDAIRASGDADMLFVAAAGNNNADNDASPYYPATYPLDNVISVAATDHNDAKASFSSYGATTVDLAAPGVGIYSTQPGGGYAYKDGTSMATPHAAGVAALAWSAATDASADFIKQAMLSGVDPVPAMDGITVTGGRLNAYNTLQHVGMAVSGSTPANGSISTSRPTEFVIEFSFPVDPGTIDAGDLLVNGAAANDYVYDAAFPNTVTFQFTDSPVAEDAEGLQTMYMAAGAIATSSIIPNDSWLHEWNATFRYDKIRMQVVATSPSDGSVVPLSWTDMTITMNEPLDESSIGIDDLLLSQGEVVTATPVDGDGDSLPESVTYTLAGIVEEGTFVAVMPAGAVTDRNGNPMQPYNGVFELDFQELPFPASFVPVEPRGSLIYSAADSGSVRVAGDIDEFTIDVTAGQTIVVQVTPDTSLQPTMTLTSPTGTQVASVTASTAGESVMLPVVATTESGAYKLTLGGAGDSSGEYAVQLTLNAALESESWGGPTNDTVATAESLDAFFIPLAADAERAAVLGSSDGYDTSSQVISTYTSPDTRVRIPDPGTVTSTVTISDSYPIADLNVLLDITHSYDADLEVFLVAPDGTQITLFTDTGGSGNSFSGTILDDQATLPITTGTAPFTGSFKPQGSLAAVNGLDVSGTWTLKVTDDKRGDKGKINSWSLEVTAAPPRPDYYAMNLEPGDSATLALLASTAGNIDLAIADPSGAIIDTATAGSANLHKIIDGFTAPEAGTYYAVVNGDPGIEYSLIVTSNAHFDAEPNNDFTTVQVLENRQVALGSVHATDSFFVAPHSGGLDGPMDLVFGSDGKLYVTGFYDGYVHGDGDVVHRYDAVNGAFIDVYIHGAPYGEGLTFGPDGDLYFADGNVTVTRYDAATGAAVQTYSWNVPRGLAFGPDGYLYVASIWDSVGRFDVDTGELIDEFIPGGTGGLDFAWDLVFGPDVTGDDIPELIVSSFYSGDVLRFNGSTGEFIDTLVAKGYGGLTGPRGLLIGPDTNQDGTEELYVAAGDVLHYDAVTGEFLGVHVARGSGGLDLAQALAFGPDGSLYVAGSEGVLRFHTPLKDLYQTTLAAGDVLDVSTATPLGGINQFDPLVNIYDANGILVASDDNSAPDGRNAQLSYVVPSDAAGTYYVEVASGGAVIPQTGGEYILSVEVARGPGITVTPTTGLTTSEAGDMASFLVALNAAPTADVTISVTSSDTSEGTVAPDTITFTSENWDQPQVVTVTGVDDSDEDGDIPYTIILENTSTGGNYLGIDPADVDVINVDDDIVVDALVFDSIDTPKQIADAHPVKGAKETTSYVEVDQSILIEEISIEITLEGSSDVSDLTQILLSSPGGIEAPVTPQYGTLIQPLDGFGGIDAFGTWTLTITDSVKGNSHTLASWSLTILPAADSSGGQSGAFSSSSDDSGLSDGWRLFGPLSSGIGLPSTDGTSEILITAIREGTDGNVILMTIQKATDGANGSQADWWWTLILPNGSTTQAEHDTSATDLYFLALELTSSEAGSADSLPAFLAVDDLTLARLLASDLDTD